MAEWKISGDEEAVVQPGKQCYSMLLEDKLHLTLTYSFNKMTHFQVLIRKNELVH